jgi:hypothetical protein
MKKFQAVLVNTPENLPLATKRKLSYLKNFISNGILFLWSEKEDVCDWLEIFENNSFCYIENLAWIKVREDSLEESNATKDFTMGYL